MKQRCTTTYGRPLCTAVSDLPTARTNFGHSPAATAEGWLKGHRQGQGSGQGKIRDGNGPCRVRRKYVSAHFFMSPTPETATPSVARKVLMTRTDAALRQMSEEAELVVQTKTGTLLHLHATSSTRCQFSVQGLNRGPSLLKGLVRQMRHAKQRMLPRLSHGGLRAATGCCQEKGHMMTLANPSRERLHHFGKATCPPRLRRHLSQMNDDGSSVVFSASGDAYLVSVLQDASRTETVTTSEAQRKQLAQSNSC